MTRNIHFVVPDLFLPQDVNAHALADLRLPALEKTLGRARQQELSNTTLESWLCTTFDLDSEAIAPVTLRADGGDPGASYWLRADPVHLGFYHDQLIVRPVAPPSAEEATRLCAALNEHFAGDGMLFVAAHPERWYLRLQNAPQMSTVPIAQVAGRTIDGRLPQGADALHWHRVLNEIQMVLFHHPLNEAREREGQWAINSVWLWGGGCAGKGPTQAFRQVFTDSQLVAAFATVAGISHAALPENERECMSRCLSESQGDTLIAWDGLRAALERGDLGAWRDSLLQFEHACMHPAFQELRGGRLDRITLDVPQKGVARRFVLTPGNVWQFWRRRRPGSFALV